MNDGEDRVEQEFIVEWDPLTGQLVRDTRKNPRCTGCDKPVERGRLYCVSCFVTTNVRGGK